MVVVVICGGGNGAHVAAGIAASQPGVEARVLTLFADEAELWTKLMSDGGSFTVTRVGRDELKGKPAIISKDPAVVMSGCNIIVFVVPAFAHAQYLTALKPHAKPGMALVGMPGNAGFEFQVRGIWGDVAKEITMMSFESLPWACRIKEFGKHAEVLGTKEALMGAILPPNDSALAMLQQTLGDKPKMVNTGHLLGITLMGTNGYIHPSIMYATWKDWDGKPFDQPQLFYTAVDQAGAKVLSDISDEILNIAKGIMEKRPKVDLTNVTHVYQWYLRCYEHDIQDNTNLYTAVRTNKAYTGLNHPMREENGKYVPDFTYRYMTEDIPFGLVVMRGIAQVVDVATPVMDEVIMWAQKIMGKEYLVDGVLKGKDIGSSRAPQAYGISELDVMLGLA